MAALLKVRHVPRPAETTVAVSSRGRARSPPAGGLGGSLRGSESLRLGLE